MKYWLRKCIPYKEWFCKLILVQFLGELLEGLDQFYTLINRHHGQNGIYQKGNSSLFEQNDDIWKSYSLSFAYPFLFELYNIIGLSKSCHYMKRCSWQILQKKEIKLPKIQQLKFMKPTIDWTLLYDIKNRNIMNQSNYHVIINML